jgi:hydrogenase expression/formation protein HypE
MRDATRGGVASVVNEIGMASDVTLVVEEKDVPLSEGVISVCSLLGMSPLDMANEGKLIAAVAPQDAEKVFEAMKQHPLGRQAAVIGRVEEKGKFPAIIVTPLGVRNILEMPRGELLPRIC